MRIIECTFTYLLDLLQRARWSLQILLRRIAHAQSLCHAAQPNPLPLHVVVQSVLGAGFFKPPIGTSLTRARPAQPIQRKGPERTSSLLCGEREYVTHGHAFARTAPCKPQHVRKPRSLSLVETRAHSFVVPVGRLTIRCVAACAVLTVASTNGLGQSLPLNDPGGSKLLREMLRDGVLTLDERVTLVENGVQPNIVPQHVDRLRARRLSAPRDLGPTLVLPIRSPMTSGELEKIMRVIGPSDEQRKFIADAFASYHDGESERWRASTAELWEFAAHTAARGMKDDDSASAIGRVYRDAMRLDELAREADQAFFLQVSLILSDQQMLGLQRAQWLRERTSIPSQPAIHAGADVDLSLLLDAVLAAHVDGHAAPDEALTELLVEYEARLTRLCTDLQRSHFEAEIERIDNLIKTRSAGPNIGLRMRLLDERKRIMAEPLRISRSIYDLNAVTMNKMRERVHPDIYNALRDEYLVRTYPVAYPIDDRVALAIDGIWKNNAEDELVYTVLPTVLAQLRAELDTTADRMAALSRMWKVRVAESSGFMPDEYGAYRDQMHALLRRQLAAQLRAIEMIEAACPRFESEFDTLRDSVEGDYSNRLKEDQGSPTTWPDPFGNDRPDAHR